MQAHSESDWAALHEERSVESVVGISVGATAASLAVQSGANIKGLQRMLGHKSAAMSLDTYADLFDEDLTAVANAMSEARKLALAA